MVKKKGIKVRVRYPAMTSGYISYTFPSKTEARSYIRGLLPNQRRRAKITRA